MHGGFFFIIVVIRQKRNVNRLASAEQVCDDPCTLCGLLMFEGRPNKINNVIIL